MKRLGRFVLKTRLVSGKLDYWEVVDQEKKLAEFTEKKLDEWGYKGPRGKVVLAEPLELSSLSESDRVDIGNLIVNILNAFDCEEKRKEFMEGRKIYDTVSY